MAYSASSSQLRRHYPRELDGAKNEWKALVDHYSEAGFKSNQVESSYQQVKAQMQKQVLEQQYREAEDAKKRNQQEVLDMERRILERDQDLYNRDRVKQLEEKAKRTTVFVNHNDALVEMKRFQQHKDKSSQLQQELNMLDAEKQSKDLNYIRAAERMNKTKAVFDDNMKMQDLNQLYADRNRINNNDLMRDGQYGKTGDIFDSMFERQQHWRNFYGNVVNNHQLRNIGKHESNSLQRELIKDVKLHDLVDKRMIEVDRRSVEQLYQKQSDYDTLRNKYQHEISNDYKLAQNRKDDQKVARKAEMLELAEQRNMEKEHEKQMVFSKMMAKREDQAKYRDVLDVQRMENDQKNLNRNKMTNVEKKVNYDDLQEYKNYGPEVYSHSVPGIAPTVNPNMAKRVLTLFGKN